MVTERQIAAHLRSGGRYEFLHPLTGEWVGGILPATYWDDEGDMPLTSYRLVS